MCAGVKYERTVRDHLCPETLRIKECPGEESDAAGKTAAAAVHPFSVVRPFVAVHPITVIHPFGAVHTLAAMHPFAAVHSIDAIHPFVAVLPFATTLPFAGQNPGLREQKPDRQELKHPLFRALRASTLVETLVMMLVAGIVFLTVMDGLTLFSRLQARRMEALTAAGRQREGYYRTVSLISRSDSILSAASGHLELYRAGRRSELSLSDSSLIFAGGNFRDTLLRGVGTLRLETCENVPDTVTIELAGGFMAKFPVRSAARQYDTALEEIEKTYVYEE